MLPEEGEFIPAPPIDQRGHTGFVILQNDVPGSISKLRDIPTSFTEAWASIVPAAKVNGVVTDYLSFTNTSGDVDVEGPTVISLYWR